MTEEPPKCVDFAANVFGVVGLLFGLFSPVVLLVGCFVGPHLIVPAVAYLGITIALFFLRSGLRRQKLWAQWSGILLGAGIIVVCGIASWQMFIAGGQQMIGIPFFFAVGVLFAYTTAALMRKTVRKWFWAESDTL